MVEIVVAVDYATIANNFMLAIIAMCTAYGAWKSKQAVAKAEQTLEVTKKTEINTNSMKDALVDATKKASHAEGFEKGLEKAVVIAQDLSLKPNINGEIQKTHP